MFSLSACLGEHVKVNIPSLTKVKEKKSVQKTAGCVKAFGVQANFLGGAIAYRVK